jgi:hypothetical protein
MRTPCTAGMKLKDRLSDAVESLMKSDSDMKDPAITLRIRDARWKASATLVSEIRKEISRHQTECPFCSDAGVSGATR